MDGKINQSLQYLSLLKEIINYGIHHRIMRGENQMISFLNRLIIVTVIGFIFSCTGDQIILETKTDRLSINVKIDPKVKTIDIEGNEYQKLTGKIVVKNITDIEQYYGNEYLHLCTEQINARTYCESFITFAVDFAAMTISAQDSLVIPAYWIFSVSDSINLKVLNINFNYKLLQLEMEKLVSPAATE